MCPVIDRTQKHLNKITKRKAGGESRIHQLGINSVKCWQHDLECISNYNLGDMPEVIIEKLVIGKRK